MMEGHEKAVYKDLAGNNDVSMEVNWSSKSEDTIRITIDGKSAVVKYLDIYGFILLNAEGEQVDELTPKKHTLVRKVVKQHVIQAQKNIKKGQNVVVNCEVDVPVSVVQSIRGELGNIDTRTSPIVAPG